MKMFVALKTRPGKVIVAENFRTQVIHLQIDEDECSRKDHRDFISIIGFRIVLLFVQYTLYQSFQPFQCPTFTDCICEVHFETLG